MASCSWPKFVFSTRGYAFLILQFLQLSGHRPRVGSAERRTTRDYGQGVYPNEPEITAALVARIRDALDGHLSGGICWTARVLNPQTEEPRIGADIATILKLDLPDYAVAKGFLVQAKRQEPGSKLNTNDWNRLGSQCRSMLRYSQESFVFIYSLNGITAVPAISVLACRSRTDLHTLYNKDLKTFFLEHFQCWIGHRIEPKKGWTTENPPGKNALEITAAIAEEKHPQQSGKSPSSPS